MNDAGVVKAYRSEIFGRIYWRIVRTPVGPYRFTLEENEDRVWSSKKEPAFFNDIDMAKKEVEKRIIVQVASACDGMEVHRDQWDLIRELLSEKRIADIGSPRGPDQAWKRIEPLPSDEEG